MKRAGQYLVSFFRIVRNGEFTLNTRYVRKRIDFNIFDDIGHGHKIHKALFDMIPSLDRQLSTEVDDPFQELDRMSAGSSNANYPTLRRRSSVIKRPNYLTTGRSVDIRASTSTTVKFPAMPTAFPTAPTSGGRISFPKAPESPPPPYLSWMESEKLANELFRQVSHI